MQLPDFLTENELGHIRLRGRRIGLYDVITDFKDGHSIAQIGEEFELSDALVQAVVDFYHANKAEVETYMAHYDAEAERVMNDPAVKKVSLDELRRLYEERASKAV
jgi:uncharacterized protein (DUF433 family)